MSAALRLRSGITQEKMFGGYCWLLNGNMLCGVEVGRFMFRVGRALEAEALTRPGASPMDITGRAMKGFVWVRAEEVKGTVLEDWIDLAVRHVGFLPAK